MLSLPSSPEAFYAEVKVFVPYETKPRSLQWLHVGSTMYHRATPHVNMHPEPYAQQLPGANDECFPEPAQIPKPFLTKIPHPRNIL